MGIVVALTRGNWRSQPFSAFERRVILGIYREYRKHLPVDAEEYETDRGDPIFSMVFSDGEPHITISKVGRRLVATAGVYQDTVLYDGEDIVALATALWVPVDIALKEGQ